MKNSKTNTDEMFARELLRKHLTSCETLGFSCRLNTDDPPDLIVTWDDRTKWGVEVTQTHLQVEGFQQGGIVSSASVSEPLLSFGEELGERMKELRNRSYTLSFEGPGLLSSWPRDESLKKWKRKTEEEIRQHIISGKSCVLKRPGVILQPSEPGKRWTVTAGAGGVVEISSATDGMLRRAVETKAANIRKWSSGFNQRWLLLLNCYPLVDDCAVVDTLRHLARQGSVGFDGIFWSGYPDRTLVPIRM